MIMTNYYAVYDAGAPRVLAQPAIIIVNNHYSKLFFNDNENDDENDKPLCCVRCRCSTSTRAARYHYCSKLQTYVLYTIIINVCIVYDALCNNNNNNVCIV